MPTGIGTKSIVAMSRIAPLAKSSRLRITDGLPATGLVTNHRPRSVAANMPMRTSSSTTTVSSLPSGRMRWMVSGGVSPW